jgi:hypothetical protein
LAAAVGLATTLFAPAAWAEQRGNNVHVEDQLEQDLTPLPAGMGAVFVPSLTSASQEPAVVVERQGERLASGPTGGRIVVPPGSYRVLIGLGDNDGKAAVEVEVKEGKTAVVKPFFGAVRINLVSASGEAVAGDYVIASVDRKQSYGPVSMEKGPKAHAQPSWLLPPGRYVVVFGRNPEARENSFAFTVTAGEIARYRLVIDGDRVVRSEFGDDPVRDTEKIWRLRWVIGASGSLTRNQSTFNGVQGQWLFGNAFSRFEAGIDTLQHLALLRLNVDQTFLGVKDEYGHQKPIRPYTNEVEGELLYNFRVAGAIGDLAAELELHPGARRDGGHAGRGRAHPGVGAGGGWRQGHDLRGLLAAAAPAGRGRRADDPRPGRGDAGGARGRLGAAGVLRQRAVPGGARRQRRRHAAAGEQQALRRRADGDRGAAALADRLGRDPL